MSTFTLHFLYAAVSTAVAGWVLGYGGPLWVVGVNAALVVFNVAMCWAVLRGRV